MKKVTIDGQEYELVNPGVASTSSDVWYGLKPIQPVKEEKQEIYWIEYRKRFKQLNDKAVSFWATDEQAEALAAAIEALVEYVQIPLGDVKENGAHATLMQCRDEARKAMQS